MRVVVWRFVVVAAYAFWQGGFLFYTSEVVPIGTDVLGSAREQGFITRLVAERMNQAGIVALAIFGADLWLTRGQSQKRRAYRTVFWAGLVALHAMLIFLHPQLDAMLDPMSKTVRDPESFHVRHRFYLWASTVQWFLGLAYLGLAILAWREDDVTKSNANTEMPKPKEMEIFNQ